MNFAKQNLLICDKCIQIKLANSGPIAHQPQISLKSASNQPQISLKSASNQPQISLKSASNQPQISPKSAPNQPQISLTSNGRNDIYYDLLKNRTN